MAQSQQPSPGRGKVAQAQQQQPSGQKPEAQTEIPVSGGQPITVQVNPSAAQPQAATPSQNTQQQNPSAPINYSDWILAALTLGLLIVAVFQLLNYRAALVTTKAIERAWVSLESLEVEGDDPHHRVITAGFKNAGHTTARIQSANITLRSATDIDGTITHLPDLPDDPVYDAGAFVPPAILVPGEISRMRFALGRESSEDLLNSWALRTPVPSETREQWIYGYITYTDGLEPGKIRTYKWARRYDPWLSRHTTPPKYRFAHIDKPKYNYAD